MSQSDADRAAWDRKSQVIKSSVNHLLFYRRDDIAPIIELTIEMPEHVKPPKLSHQLGP